MKPTRKITRRSFITQVAGDGGAPGGAFGKGKPGGASDHDLAFPAEKGGGSDPDRGPEGGGAH